MSVDKTRQSREQTREELAETLEALAHKADVKSRATASARQTWARTREQVDNRAIMISGFGVLVLGLVLLVRRRNR